MIHFYIIHKVYIITINVYITLPNMIHITLYLDEIPSDHATWRWLFVCTFLTELKQSQTFACNCSLFQLLTDHRAFCQYLETTRVSQFIQPIAYNAGQQPFLAMTLGSIVGSHRILVRLTHSLVLSCRTRHRTKSHCRCSPSQYRHGRADQLPSGDLR